MKVDKDFLRNRIEDIIADGVMTGEEIDITTNKIMKEIDILIKAAEYVPKTNQD